MTKREARAQRAAWREAVSEGRVIRYNDGLTARSYPTVEATHAALARFRAAGIAAVIVIPPEQES